MATASDATRLPEGRAMRRAVTLLAMGGALVAAHLLNTWLIEARAQMFDRVGTGDATTFDTSWHWLFALVPLVTAAMALGLGWLVLRVRRPDPVVGTVFTVVGLVVVTAIPVYFTESLQFLPFQDWPISQLLDGVAAVIWEGAAIAVIGLAELGRWIGYRRAGSVRPADPPPPDSPAVASL